MIEIKDLLTIIATLLSPLIAVQVTKWIERKRVVRDEQVRVFKTLMATRATNLDPRHVEALNIIDVIFSSDSQKEAKIRQCWKQYLDHLNDSSYARDVWNARRVELFIELLYVMAIFLGFDFDKVHLKNQAYYPVGHGDIEDDNLINRKSLRALLTGESHLSVNIVNIPSQSKD